MPNNVDEDRDKMRIYKNGYTTGVGILRTDISVGRKQYKYNTFAFKACSAERLPNPNKAKGFSQRIIVFKCNYGEPKYDILDIVTNAGDPKFKKILEDLSHVRNILLTHRLLHYHDAILNIEISVRNREKQLFKPIIRVFQDSPKALEELKTAINFYLSDYRKRRSKSLHAFYTKL